MSRWTLRMTLLTAALLTTALLSSAGFAQTNIWIMTHTHPPFNEWVQARIVEYEALNPDVKIEYNHVIHAEFDEKMMVMLASGAAPDVMNVYYPTMHDLQRGGFLVPAPDDVVQDMNENFIRAAWEGMVVNGVIYGYPTEATLILPIVNERLFAEYGVAFPETWDDLQEVQRTLSRFDDNGNPIQRGVSIGASGLHLILRWAAMLRAEGADILDENGQPAFNTPAGIEATRKYKEISPIPGLNFVREQVGLYMFGSHWRISAEQQNPFLEYRALPALKGQDGVPVTTAYHWGFVVNQQSQVQEAAWDFLRWLNGPENRIKLLQAVGYPPITHANIGFYIDDPYLQTFANEFQYGRLLPGVANWKQAETSLATQIDRYIKGQENVVQALDNADREIRYILNP